MSSTRHASAGALRDERGRAGWLLRGGWVTALAALLVYTNSLWNSFTLDDVPIVETNPIVIATPQFGAAWVTPYWPNSNRGDRDDLLYRPLTVQTYRWQHRLHGTVAWPYHLVNVLLHASVSVGVWWMARRLGAPPWAALVAGVVFAVHPVHTDAVANIVGRAELLVAGFTLLAAALALGARAGRRPAWAWVAAWLSAACALAAKENGVSALAIVAFIRLLPIDGAVASATTGQVTPPPRRPRLIVRLALAAVPALVIFGAYLAVRYEVGSHRLTVLGQRVAVSNPLRDAGELARWLTPPALLGRYVLLTLSPQRLLCDYSLNVLPPVTSVADGTLWLGLAFMAGAIVLAVRRSPRRRGWWVVLLGFASSYFLASNTLLLIDVIFAERLWYSPSIWVCVGLTFALAALAPRVAGRPRVARGVLVAAIVILSLRTVVRNADWHDTATVVARDLASLPEGNRSAQLCAFLADERARQGGFESAASLLEEAIAIYPDKALYHQMLGQVYLALDEPQAAVAALREAVTIEPSRHEALALLATAEFAASGRDIHAEYAAARAAAQANPGDIAAARLWARLAESVNSQDAVRAYLRLVELAADDPAAWSGLALAQFSAGAVEDAAATYRALLQRWPEDWRAHTNLALLLMDPTYRGIYDCAAAATHAERAVALAPSDWAVRVNLAEVTARCGDRAAAAELFDELARQSAPNSTEQRLYADRARHLRD